MRSLISALAAAGLVMVTLSGYPAEESTVKSKPDPNKPGRTIEETTVKSKPDPNKPGRTIESKADPNKPVSVPPEKPGPMAEKK